MRKKFVTDSSVRLLGVLSDHQEGAALLHALADAPCEHYEVDVPPEFLPVLGQLEFKRVVSIFLMLPIIS